jgi:hypothetical protein
MRKTVANMPGALVGVLGTIFISAVAFRVLLRVHGANLDELAQVVASILARKPIWIAYQNRLLGPALVELISWSGVTYADALNLFTFAALAIQNVVLFFLLRRLPLSSGKALLGVIAYAFAFIGMSGKWFYPWDSLDAIIFTFLAWGILQGKPLYYFVTLFCIGLLNRESALFIALYLVIDAFAWPLPTGSFFLASKGKLALGSLLILGGLAYTKFLRDWLFSGQADEANRLIGNHINLTQNIQDLFFYNLTSIAIINSVFVIGSVVGMLYFFRQFSEAQCKAALVYGAMLLSVLFFGVVNETRMYIILLPFLFFLIIGIDKNQSAAALTAGNT